MRKQEKNLLRKVNKVNSAVWRWAGYLIAIALPVFAAPGCSLFQKSDTTNDVLKGDPAITANKTNVPPAPEPSSFTPPAVAATGNLPGSGGLSFQGTEPAGKNSGWQGNTGSAAGSTTGSGPPGGGIQLKSPVPVIQPTGPEAKNMPKPPPASVVMGVAKGAPISQAKPGPVVQSASNPPVLQTGMVTVNAPPAAKIPATYEELQQELKKRGVTWQGQETTDQGVKFTCSIADPQNPNRQRVFEAVGPDYVAAIQLVLQQIDRQK
jgi:hypothetical protein